MHSYRIAAVCKWYYDILPFGTCGYDDTRVVIYPQQKERVDIHYDICYIMISKEIVCTEDWHKAKAAVLEHFQFDDPRVIKIFELVFRKLHKQPFWEITPEFITELGDLYLWIISGKELRTFAGKL